jgi:hypothetical protein
VQSAYSPQPPDGYAGFAVAKGYSYGGPAPYSDTGN